MPKKSKMLKELLRLEVTKKGKIVSIIFGLLAIITFIYGFDCVEFLPHIRILSLILILISTTRYFHYRKIINQDFITSKQWSINFIIVTLNGICFGSILALAAFELKVTGDNYLVVTALVTGITASSIINLSYAASIFIPFQIFMIIPQIVIICYFHYSNFKSNDLTLISLYIVFLIYQIRQFLNYNRDLIKFFNYQIELEQKNKELKKSQEIIVDQTLTLVHTSRLAVLGEMSVGIAHEINNPLSVISTSVQMLARTDKAGDLNKNIVTNYSEKISKAVTRISAIVNGLKLLSNQSDRVPKKEVLVEDILKETTPFCNEQFIAAGIKLEVNVPKEIILHCHPVQISQVLINLLKNAADAVMDELDTDRWIKLDYKIESDFFYFIISNGGKKISHELSQKVFKPFMTTKKHGTGIGLSISQSIINEHNGEVYLDFDNYENTTFIIKLPLTIQ